MNYTENYHLPQYVGSDMVNPLVDTNDAYSEIDTTMADHESRIAAIEQGGGSSTTGTLTAKGLTFSFRKNGNCCHVDVNGTLTATIETDVTWSGVEVENPFVPAIATRSVPVFPCDIYNNGLGIAINTSGAISAKSGVGTIPIGATISCSFDYPIA